MPARLLDDTGGSQYLRSPCTLRRTICSQAAKAAKRSCCSPTAQDSGLGPHARSRQSLATPTVRLGNRLTFDDVAQMLASGRHTSFCGLHRKSPQNDDRRMAREPQQRDAGSRVPFTILAFPPTRCISPNSFAAPAASCISCARRPRWPTLFARSPQKSAPNTRWAIILRKKLRWHRRRLPINPGATNYAWR